MVSGVFILGLAALLFAPGPTNTLLCAAGATGGLRAAPRLLGAEALAYAVSVMALGMALQPLIAWEPRLAVALQGAAALFLLKAAWSLWQGGARLAAPAAVSARMVGVATLPQSQGVGHRLRADAGGLERGSGHGVRASGRAHGRDAADRRHLDARRSPRSGGGGPGGGARRSARLGRGAPGLRRAAGTFRHGRIGQAIRVPALPICGTHALLDGAPARLYLQKRPCPEPVGTVRRVTEQNEQFCSWFPLPEKIFSLARKPSPA